MTADRAHRILFVTHTSEWIGPNISLLELVIRLPRDLKPLVAVPGEGRFTQVLGDQGVPVCLLKRIDKYGIPALVRIIRRTGSSLVYGNSAHGASRNALIAAKLCNVPFVYHLREMAGSGCRHRARLYSLADAAVAVSQATAESYRGSFRRAPHVIHNGVSIDAFDLDRVACRRELAAELEIDETIPIVIQVGNVYARKGQQTAIAVLKELLPAFPECRLLMVGRLDRDSGYVDGLRTSIREHGLEDQAILTDLRTDVPNLLAAADVFLHTARQDPHPRAVIEAMAAGLPVVALAVDGVTETIVDNETGFLVPWPCTAGSLADPVTRLLENPQLRRTMGENGRERTRRLFSAERTAHDVVDVIRALLGSR